MSQDDLEATRFALAAPSVAALTPQERREEAERQRQERRKAIRNFNRMCRRFGYDKGKRRELAEIIGFVAGETTRRFLCGCPQTPENTVPDSRPGSVRCRLHKNDPSGQRAELTYPRNKQGAA